MSTNYGQFQADVMNYVAANSTSDTWTTEFPLVIDRAEQRCYRDIDFLGTRVTDTTGTLTANNRLFNLPSATGTFVVVESISVLTPAGALSSVASRIALVRATPQLIDMTFPSNMANTGPPEWFAMLTQTTVLLGPVPDQAYGTEVRGTQRPTPLSSANSSTILTMWFPDLFFAAAMMEVGTFMRFTEPTIFTTWQGEYQALMKSALVEESRKKFYAEGWVDKLPSPVATPPRA